MAVVYTMDRWNRRGMLTFGTRKEAERVKYYKNIIMYRIVEMTKEEYEAKIAHFNPFKG